MLRNLDLKFRTRIPSLIWVYLLEIRQPLLSGISINLDSKYKANFDPVLYLLSKYTTLQRFKDNIYVVLLPKPIRTGVVGGALGENLRRHVPVCAHARMRPLLTATIYKSQPFHGSPRGRNATTLSALAHLSQVV